MPWGMSSSGGRRSGPREPVFTPLSDFCKAVRAHEHMPDRIQQAKQGTLTDDLPVSFHHYNVLACVSEFSEPRPTRGDGRPNCRMSVLCMIKSSNWLMVLSIPFNLWEFALRYISWGWSIVYVNVSATTPKDKTDLDMISEQRVPSCDQYGDSNGTTELAWQNAAHWHTNKAPEILTVVQEIGRVALSVTLIIQHACPTLTILYNTSQWLYIRRCIHNLSRIFACNVSMSMHLCWLLYNLSLSLSLCAFTYSETNVLGSGTLIADLDICGYLLYGPSSDALPWNADMIVNLSLVDPSLPYQWDDAAESTMTGHGNSTTKVEALCFCRNKNQFPFVQKAGDIVRLHTVQVCSCTCPLLGFCYQVWTTYEDCCPG